MYCCEKNAFCVLPLGFAFFDFLDSSAGAVRLLAIDFSKAFDKVPHCGILNICIKFHLAEDAVLWISSFLTNKFQSVFCNNRLSKSSRVHSLLCIESLSY